MTIRDITDIKRRESPIYYRLIYDGKVTIEFAGQVSVLGIEFTIETKPTGMKEILIRFAGTPDYPIIPLKKAIKKKIEELDESATLPI
jgi:hypothetical protein